MTLDIAGDYTLFDGGQSVTLRQIRADGSTSVAVSNVVGGVVANRRAAYAGLEITGDESAFSLNATQVGTPGVIVDDIIIDSAGVSWRVLSAEKRTLDTRWYAVCRRQV